MAAKFRNLAASRLRHLVANNNSSNPVVSGSVRVNPAEAPGLRRIEARMELARKIPQNNLERPFSIR